MSAKMLTDEEWNAAMTDIDCHVDYETPAFRAAHKAIISDRRARIAREAELLSLLRAVEWAGSACDGACKTCPSCDAFHPKASAMHDQRGHNPSCRLALAIKDHTP